MQVGVPVLLTQQFNMSLLLSAPMDLFTVGPCGIQGPRVQEYIVHYSSIHEQVNSRDQQWKSHLFPYVISCECVEWDQSQF